MIKIKELFYKTSGIATNLFKKYSLTLIIIIVTTLFLSIFLGTDTFRDTTIEKITIFSTIWAVATFLIETLSIKNKKITLISYVVTGLISLLFVKLLKNVYGAFNEHVIRIMIGYGLCLFVLALYFIIKWAVKNGIKEAYRDITGKVTTEDIEAEQICNEEEK